MKTILYVGAALMIGASIYGFVDYRKTNRNKEFTKMYKEKKVSKPEMVVSEKKITPAENKQITEKEPEKTVSVATTAKENSTEKNIKHKKRKFRLQEFSRAPLDERYIKEEIKMETPKKKSEPGKTENKEQ